MRTIHRSCHGCPFAKPPPPPPSGDSRDPPRAQANFRHPLDRSQIVEHGVTATVGLLLGRDQLKQGILRSRVPVTHFCLACLSAMGR